MQLVSAQEKAALEKKREELYKAQIDVQDRIRKAASLGDLSENAEYHFAKEENRAIQRQLAETESKLKNASVVSNDDVPDNVTIHPQRAGVEREHAGGGIHRAQVLELHITVYAGGEGKHSNVENCLGEGKTKHLLLSEQIGRDIAVQVERAQRIPEILDPRGNLARPCLVVAVVCLPVRCRSERVGHRILQ